MDRGTCKTNSNEESKKNKKKKKKTSVAVNSWDITISHYLLNQKLATASSTRQQASTY